MRFGSLCSGIDGAAVAWPTWEQVYCAEVDPFCCRLLARRYPNVVNFGDITTARQWPSVDVLVAGTPCQSFSVAGNRRGLQDARGRLSLAFASIVKQSQPQAFIWENVAGVLSSNGGRDFAAFLHALSECRYGLAWRVLDLRGFGIPQRRRRVYVVGILGDRQRPAEVLFDDGANSGNASPTAKARKGSPKILGWNGDETPKFGAEVMPTLRASQGGEGVGILWSDGMRRLTVNEWERLMGFPVDYTKGAGTASQRKKALGNAFPPPVLAWIGRRLATVIQPKQLPAKAQSSQILTLQRISSSLAAMSEVDDAKALRDKAEALRVYFQQQENCRDIEKQATVVRLRAERRIGELLAATVKAGNPNCRPGRQLPAGITRDQSSKWQAVARVPVAHFERYLEGAGSLSTKGLIKVASAPTASESADAFAERTINRLRSQLAERLGCKPASKRIDRILRNAIDNGILA